MACPQKKALEQQSTVLWVDESSFYLLPMRVTTFAPRGKTPVLRVPLAHAHLSAISAIGLTGEVAFALQPTSFESATVIRFLDQLLAQFAGHLIIIWDGAPIHRSKAITAFLSEGAAHRLHLERLPGYAPDLNPDEGMWSWLKRRLKNQCFRTLDTLQSAVIAAKEEFVHRPDLLRGCLHACPYIL